MTSVLQWANFSGGPKLTDGNHTIPLGDVAIHETNKDCWCKPLQDGYDYIHNSMDRREDYEDNYRKVN